MSQTPRFIGLISILLITFIVGAYGQQAPRAVSPLTNPVALDTASIAAGKSVFDKYCKFCHGPDAKGNGPLAPQGTHPPDLTDATWDHGSADGEIYANIRDGIGPKMDMKSFKSRLTEKEMWSTVNYLRSLGPKKP